MISVRARSTTVPLRTCSAPPSLVAEFPSIRQSSKIASPPATLTAPPLPTARLPKKLVLRTVTWPPVSARAPPSVELWMPSKLHSSMVSDPPETANGPCTVSPRRETGGAPGRIVRSGVASPRAKLRRVCDLRSTVLALPHSRTSLARVLASKRIPLLR